MTENDLLSRITVNPRIFGGKPIVRGRRLAVEHVLGMLAAGDATETILQGYPWLEREDVLACLAYSYRPAATPGIAPRLGFQSVQASGIREPRDGGRQSAKGPPSCVFPVEK